MIIVSILEKNFGSLFMTLKCFDSLWLEYCINALYANGVKDDIRDLVFKMNQDAEILFEDTIW